MDGGSRTSDQEKRQYGPGPGGCRPRDEIGKIMARDQEGRIRAWDQDE